MTYNNKKTNTIHIDGKSLSATRLARAAVYCEIDFQFDFEKFIEDIQDEYSKFKKEYENENL